MCAKRAAFQKHWFSFSFISLFFLPFLLSPIGRTIRTLLYVKHTHENALERFNRRCCCVFESTPRNVDKCISLNRPPKSTQNCCFHSVRKRLFQIYPAGGFWLGHHKIYVEVYSLKVYDVVMNPLPLNTIWFPQNPLLPSSPSRDK